jgi:thymidylate synthase
MTLNQRSNDYIMAGYINKIQYVALQMMVASHLNYKVGNCHFIQNLHIYDRHIEAALEILEREPLDQQPIIDLPTNIEIL